MKKAKEIFVKICPKCSSVDVTIERSMSATLGIFPVQYMCRRCGFVGINFPEMNTEKAEKSKKKGRK